MIAMKDFPDTNKASGISRGRDMLVAAWRWLIEPPASIGKPERRLQAGLMMGMLLVLMAIGLLSLALSFLGLYSRLDESEAEVMQLRWITLGAVLLLAVEYALSRTVHFPWAAVMAVGTVLSSIFVVVIMSPTVLQYVFFLVLGGLMASLFLSTRATGIIFIMTFVGVLMLPRLAPGYSIENNIYALFFIASIGGLVLMAASLRQRYIEQIDLQTQQLVHSEARLRDLSVHDALTGLFNRRYLEESLTLELIRAARKRSPVGIIMVDIDHFKQFNDTDGHAAGDEVLVQVGSFLRAHVRESDVTCRYGGEEFILILPEAPSKITQVRAQSMQEDIQGLRVEHQGQVLGAITLSLGVAGFPEHGTTMETILKAVDTALYRAKREGRNRVVLADPETVRATRQG
jgi:diguanylate cyclase (GGDEF)-like protein